MKKIFSRLNIICAFLIYLCFVFRVTVVQGYSMQPTLENGSVLICNTLATPQVGDIVVIRPFVAVGDQFIIKRITDIQDNKIFVQGDNRENSYDSRSFGWLDMNQVLGVVID